MDIIRFAIDRPVAVIAAVIMAVLFGLIAVTRIPIQLAPDVRKPIVVITTEGASEDRERALGLGANEYLTKPIQANRVLSVVKDLMKS